MIIIIIAGRNVVQSEGFKGLKYTQCLAQGILVVTL